ncbi:hypothetical protein SCOR_13060 [Sulfidibacter corallicola]|uniref:Uncharacterized protein n=1 Tax=Sulfidibacter corallicola TaxID=2818388 RepID=A0A8A4TEV1_SULCO|nr:hypothetical protein [Sulfidibacter corallicola]QTD47744.1 hypothetical protein J3U87_19315 [Sulfidibacter corallicola]
MTAENWIDWCQKQLGDLSARLSRQGYSPARIETLTKTSPLFRERFEHFMTQLTMVMDAMADNPDGYHHYEDFTHMKMEMLKFTNLHREQFLYFDLAESA